MIIVADTSPLNYLILIDRISILETLYRHILVPHAVHETVFVVASEDAVILSLGGVWR